jgi:hypothetical protein
MSRISRRACLGVAAMAAVRAQPPSARTVPLFDGNSLDGWIQSENGAFSLPTAGILDVAAFAAKVAKGADQVSAYLRGRLPEAIITDLAAYDPAAPNAKAVIAAFLKSFEPVLAGPLIYDRARFQNTVFRPETARLLDRNPRGLDLIRLNKLLLEDAYPAELVRSAATGWIVKDGAMASTGAGRGVIYTAKDYSRFRLAFTMRHVSGNPDHQACVLIFCTRPKPGEKPLDALAGIQFQPPNGGRWDYRPGMNNNGGEEFTLVKRPGFDPHSWSRVEIVADATQGTATMSVAQPPTGEPVEVLRFKDPAAGKPGPIAWQMHNAGLFDDYKDVTISEIG